MSNHFEWQTGEESEWLDTEQENLPQTAVSYTRFWPVLLLSLIGLGIVGTLLFRQAKEQVAAATADVETDILTTHRLIQTAVSNNDAELFHSQLSARNSEWIDIQDALIAEGLLYQRPFYLLPFRIGEGPVADDIMVTIAPDLRAAEVQFPQVYRVGLDEVETVEVVLWQTAVYRRGSKKWLLSPPLHEFWGEWQTVTGQWLTVHYPTRDAQIASQLANDLDTLISTLCADISDINCDTDLEIELRLDTDPASLMSLDDLKYTIQSGSRLELPAPTLIGLPKDALAYDLVFRSYAIQVATAVIAHQVGYDCCEQGVFFRTILERQLAQLNLVNWPPVTIDHIDILNRWGGANYFTSMWEGASIINRDSVYAHRFYPLIDMLEQENSENISLVEMQRRLSQHDSLESWLFGLLGEVDFVTFETQLQRYILHNSATYAASTPPYPPPTQRLQLQCYSSSGNEGIYQYDPMSDTWTTYLAPESDNGFGRFSMRYALQPDLLVTITRGSLNENSRQRIISVQKESTPVLYLEIQLDLFDDVWVGTADQTGQYLILSYYSMADSYISKYELVDLRNCDGLNCARLPLSGFPIWSPNGRFTLITVPSENATDVNQETEINLGDAQGQPLQAVGTGTVPFWLNDERYIFIKDGVEMVTAVTNSANPSTLFTLDDLTPHLSPEVASLDLKIQFWGVTNVPVVSSQILLFVYDNTANLTGSRWYFLLSLNATDSAVEQIEMIHETTNNSWVTLSPDQRWVTEISYTSDGIDGSIDLINLETNEEETLERAGFSYVWSSDSNWIAYTRGNVLVFLAPGTGYQFLTHHPFTNCWNMIWVDP
jgi:hypothetical protein